MREERSQDESQVAQADPAPGDTAAARQAGGRRRSQIALVVGLVCCAGIFFSALQYRGSAGLYSRDSQQYWNIGVNFAAGNGLSYDGEKPTRMRQPVYPLVLAAMISTFGPEVRPIQILQLVFAMLIVALVMAIARELFGRRTAAVAAVAAGVYYPLTVIATEIRTEVIFVLIVALAVLTALRAVRMRSLGWAAVCGVCLGLATLTRAPGAAFVALIPLAVWLVLRGARLSWREPLVTGIVAVLLLLPWGVRNYLVLGEFHVLSEAGPAGMYVGMHPLVIDAWADYMNTVEATEEYKELLGDGPYLGEEPARRFKQAVRERFRREPLAVLWRGVLKIGLTWTYAPGSRPLLTSKPWAFRLLQIPQLVLLGLIFYGARHDSRRGQYLAAALFLGTSAAMFLGTPTARYTFPFMPLGLALAANGLTTLARSSRGRRERGQGIEG